ncbi:MAG TPA: fused MFS/spermidine synthase [Polyangiaceae bacterium]|nr:fused MFS/spermidine synthase [Polyangiaceae bacterium]
MSAEKEEASPAAKPSPASGQGNAVASRAVLGRAELYCTVFMTGTAVMLIEILGTRVIGPVFGVSLFVWSALLAVTLTSLAVGYYSGGVLADRRPEPRLLGAVVLASGVLLGLAPFFGPFMLRAAEGLGPRAGALLAATIFAPCLAVLGMVGPIAVRLSTTDLAAAGHRVGSVYAMSTAGSLAGTLLTGFVLIPAFETDQILVGAATLLALMGGVSMAWRGKPVSLVAVLLPVVASSAAKAPLPTGIRVLDHAQSLYGLVQVIEDSKRGVRLLRADHSIIGAQWIADRSAAFSFLHLLETVWLLRPAAADVLQIGLGIGSLGMSPGGRRRTVDVVEIDPAVVRFAQEYFAFSTRGEIHVEDARTYLRRTDRRYDLIVHDTFTGGSTPEHLLSLEVIQQIHRILRPGGVLALNFVGYENGPHAEATWAVGRTLRAVFPNVRIFRDGAGDDPPDEPQNLVFFASEGPLEFEGVVRPPFESEACERVLRSFRKWEISPQGREGQPITDAHNPLTRLQLAAAEKHFAAMHELLPVEVWLH